MIIVTIILLLAVFIYGIFEMNKSSKKVSKESLEGLTFDDKTKAVSTVKRFWKVTMILLATVIGFIFIMISQIVGKTTIHSNLVSIIAIVYCLVIYLIITFRKKKMISEINKYMK